MGDENAGENGMYKILIYLFETTNSNSFPELFISIFESQSKKKCKCNNSYKNKHNL